MLKLKVRKTGKSLGVVLPNKALDRLHANEGTLLFLVFSPRGLYLTPCDPAFEKRMKKARDIIGRYRNTLHALASK